MTRHDVDQRVQAEIVAWVDGCPSAVVVRDDVDTLFEAVRDACWSLSDDLDEAAASAEADR
jgi:hypothetical protein